MERLDDRNPALSYQGSWFYGGVSREYNSTTMGTRAKGSTMTFIFNGTSVEVYGTLSDNTHQPNPVNLFRLDDDPTPVTFAPQAAATAQYDVRMYASPPLASDKPHKLEMETTIDSSDTYIDYVQYKAPDVVTSTSSSITSSPTTTPSSNTPLANQNTTSSSSKLSNGAIAGISVAAVVLVACLLYAFRLWWLMRKKSDTTRYDDGSQPQVSYHSIQRGGFDSTPRVSGTLSSSFYPSHSTPNPHSLHSHSQSQFSNEVSSANATMEAGAPQRLRQLTVANQQQFFNSVPEDPPPSYVGEPTRDVRDRKGGAGRTR